MSEPVILLAEDSEDDALLIGRSFRKVGVSAPLRVVTDGEQAVQYLSGEPPYADRGANPLPALMLLDLKLPKRTGLEVLEWVRGQDGLRRLPVIVLTSSAEAVDVRRAYDLGANSYLVKPVSPTAMQTLMTQLHAYWLTFNERPSLGVA